ANRAALDKQQLGRPMTIDAVARAARGADLTDVHGALAEGGHVLQLEAGIARLNPSEAVGINDHRLLVARWRILDGAPVDVFPNRLVAVLVNDAAVGSAARKDSAVELAKVAHLFVAGVQLLIAHEAVAS